MVILNQCDAATYAPDVTLTGDALDSALFYTQSLVESGRGANRPLEITSFVERKQVNLNAQTVYLSYLPVLEEPPPVIKVRTGNTQNITREVIPVSEWTTIEPDAYILDVDGRLNFNENFYRYFNYGYHRGSGYHKCHYVSECELTYSSGLDFTQNTPEINQLKVSASRILAWIYGNNVGVYQGVKRLKVPFKEFEVEWSDKQTPGTIPDDLFLPFIKYRPVN